MARSAQITIRSLDDKTLAHIDHEAEIGFRSREKQVVYMLTRDARQASVADQYIQGVAQRLRHALANVTQLSRFSSWTAAKAGAKSGLEYGHEIEAAFAGDLPLSFTTLDALAETLGVASDWLNYGEGPAYPMRDFKLEGDPAAVVEALLTPARGTLSKLHLIRINDQCGSLYIVRELADTPRCEAFHTRYHLSEEIGAGGEGDLQHVFRVFQSLVERRGNVAGRVPVLSHMAPAPFPASMEDPDYPVNPLVALKHSTKQPWVEDIWDASMLGRTEYWPGQHAFSRRIIRAQQITEERRSDSAMREAQG